MPSLTSEERSFFSLVQEATAANPFSEEREQLDRKIVGRYGQKKPTHTISEAIQEVGRRIERLEQNACCNIKVFKGRDRELVQGAFLFHTFHRYIPSLFIECIND